MVFMDKKRFSVITECVGAIIFVLGAIFYFSYAAKIAPTNEKISKEIAEKIFFYWNVSAVIMLIGGLFVLLGLVSLGIKIVIEILKHEKENTALGFSIVKITVMSVVPFVIPMIFYYIYQPVNENVIVKHFGCGCPRLVDGRYNYFGSCLDRHMEM